MSRSSPWLARTCAEPRESPEKTFNALGRENVNLIAIAPGISECNISFVIEEQAVKTALITTHREFGLDRIAKLKTKRIRLRLLPCLSFSILVQSFQQVFHGGALSDDGLQFGNRSV